MAIKTSHYSGVSCPRAFVQVPTRVLFTDMAVSGAVNVLHSTITFLPTMIHVCHVSTTAMFQRLQDLLIA